MRVLSGLEEELRRCTVHLAVLDFNGMVGTVVFVSLVPAASRAHAFLPCTLHFLASMVM